jgi:hypothetical protein
MGRVEQESYPEFLNLLFRIYMNPYEHAWPQLQAAARIPT